MMPPTQNIRKIKLHGLNNELDEDEMYLVWKSVIQNTLRHIQNNVDDDDAIQGN